MSVKKVGRAKITFNSNPQIFTFSAEGSGISFLQKDFIYNGLPSDADSTAIQMRIYKLRADYFIKPLRLGVYKNAKDSESYADKIIMGELLYCYYEDNIYKFDRCDYSSEEMVLQITDLEDAERKKFERLKHKFAVANHEEKEDKRPAIPEEVRIAVWRRDCGKCVKCGSRGNLEYDHIIPISKGV